MTTRRIGLVAWHVFKESVRDRVLYGIAGFAVLLVAASILINAWGVYWGITLGW